MRDEKDRAARRELEAGGVEERASFLAGLVSSAAPCKACGGARKAACHHAPESMRLCTSCLGSGLAMDEGRLRLAAWLGDDAAASAMSCVWCGGSRIVDSRPCAVNSTSSSTLVYPDLDRVWSAFSGESRVRITSIWPEYKPCGWCSKAEPEWDATRFAEAVAFRVGMALGDGSEAVRVAAVGSCLGLLRTGPLGLPDAWEALMDWTICPCEPRFLEVSRCLAEFRGSATAWEAPEHRVLAVVDALEVALEEGPSNPFLVIPAFVARGIADDASAIRAACGTLARMCMGATWD